MEFALDPSRTLPNPASAGYVCSRVQIESRTCLGNMPGFWTFWVGRGEPRCGRVAVGPGPVLGGLGSLSEVGGEYLC